MFVPERRLTATAKRPRAPRPRPRYNPGMPNEYVEPLGNRILVRKDEGRTTTRGGIVLPDDAEIPTITGRVVEISALVERDSDVPVRKYDKVLFHPKRAIPVDLEADNKLYVVPTTDVWAVFRRDTEPVSRDADDDQPKRLEGPGGETAGAA